jgi:glycosyltransferase involved in cell wall biosynthesis
MDTRSDQIFINRVPLPLCEQTWDNDVVPLVSIKCTAYNHEEYISDTINGFLLQKTTFPVEIIIHDDASTDRTADIVREYASKYPNLIRPHFQNENQYSKGFRTIREIMNGLCRGTYIALCEGDDFWTDPLKLQKQVDFLKMNPQHVMCFHRVKILERDGLMVDDYITTVPNNYESIENFAKYGNYIHMASVVHNNIPLNYPDELHVSPAGDYFIYMLLAQHGKIGMLDEVMAVYRNQVGVWSSQSDRSKKMKSFLVLLLMQSAFRDTHSTVSKTLEKRIDSYFESMFPTLTEHEFQYFRVNTAASLQVDELIVKHRNNYVQNQVQNTSSADLAIHLLKRLVKLVIRKK